MTPTQDKILGTPTFQKLKKMTPPQKSYQNKRVDKLTHENNDSVFLSVDKKNNKIKMQKNYDKKFSRISKRIKANPAQEF